MQEYPNAYIWMWHKMDRLGSPDDPTQLFINHGKLVVRWYRLHGRSVDVPACLGRLRTARTFYSSDWLYQEIAMPRIVLNGWAATLALTGLAVLPLSSCANADTARTASTQEDTMKSGASPMLEEIYASKSPFDSNRSTLVASLPSTFLWEQQSWWCWRRLANLQRQRLLKTPQARWSSGTIRGRQCLIQMHVPL